MQGRVISFINLKGGVGKTTSAINIANKLADDNKVLIIDMDPQFNATQSLLNHQLSHYSSFIPKEITSNVSEKLERFKQKDGINSQYSKSESDEEFLIQSQMIYQNLKDNNVTAKSLYSKDNLVNEIKTPDLIYKIKDDLSLIPGDLDLFTVLNGDTAGKHNVIHDHIKSYDLREKFDYIIIDCPPNWTILTQSSLFASDYYIIPSKIDLFSSIGINLLEGLVKSTFFNKSSKLYSTYTMFRTNIHREPLKPLGILFTLTHNIVVSDKVKRELKNEMYSQVFFETEIPYHSSVPMKFSMYSEIGEKHKSLTNAIDKVVEEIYSKVKSIEGEGK